MLRVKNPTIEDLVQQLYRHRDQKFTGRLEITSAKICWSLFYCLGRLVWATGGTHPKWRFQRIAQRVCPQILSSKVNLRASDAPKCPNYHRLTILARRGDLNQRQSLTIIEQTLKEILFDILQHEASAPLDYISYPGEGIENAWTLMSALVRPEPVLRAAQQQWQSWQAEGLALYSPNLAPIIVKPEALQAQTSPQTYNNLSKILDGQQSLRDLSLLLKKDVQLVTLSLMSYINQGLIKLISVPELPRLKPPKIVNKKDLKKPLVVCIDDCPLVGNQMNQIISGAGYRYLNIQEPVTALPKLLEAKPSLVFLDLVMPIANGYELCTWIRRVSAFKDLPVIILTGNDGIIDRVRARVVGATEFISKPVTQESVLDNLQKYL